MRTNGAGVMKVAATQKETEAQIQKGILQWGGYKKILMHRINVIGTPLHKDGLTIYRPSTNAGMADIHATVIVEEIPVSVWLEVKTKQGKQSHRQKEFQYLVETAGGFYFIVRSIDDVEAVIKTVKFTTWANISGAIPF
jgi:hypothetical protein